mmetsp:Transcript_116158/g.205713  ORF Transcript_116158/g.205713 Transcript_116158/m.205713 type:complete len:241 (-) Transcript_116158:585-1307(-)
MHLSFILQWDGHHWCRSPPSVRLELAVLAHSFVRRHALGKIHRLWPSSKNLVRHHSLPSFQEVLVASRSCPWALIPQIRASVAEAQLDLGVVTPRERHLLLDKLSKCHGVPSTACHLGYCADARRKSDQLQGRGRRAAVRVGRALAEAVAADAVKLSSLRHEGSVRRSDRHPPDRLGQAAEQSAVSQAPSSPSPCRKAVQNHLRNSLPDDDVARCGEGPDCRLRALHIHKPYFAATIVVN